MGTENTNTETSNAGGGIVGSAMAEKPAAEAGGVQAPGKTEGAAAAEGEQKADAGKTVAAELELKLPEGFKADEAAVGEFKQIAKELGLDGPKAQKFFDLYAKTEAARAKAQVQQQEQALDQQEKRWEEQIQADKELGGANFPGVKTAIKKALVRFDPKGGFMKAITDAGLGSHPEVVRFINGAGSALAEDRVGPTGNGAEPTAPSQEQLLRERFPNSFDLMNGKRS